MPQRNREKTIYGGQGDDAWVKLRMPTVAEKDEFARLATDENEKGAQRETNARQYVAGFVVDWNWVNDDGTPLPSPSTAPDIFGQLLQDEANFILQAWTGVDPQTAAAKKK